MTRREKTQTLRKRIADLPSTMMMEGVRFTHAATFGRGGFRGKPSLRPERTSRGQRRSAFVVNVVLEDDIFLAYRRLGADAVFRREVDFEDGEDVGIDEDVSSAVNPVAADGVGGSLAAFAATTSAADAQLRMRRRGPFFV